MFPFLTDNQLAVVREVVGGDLEVQRGGAFPDAARDVVVGAVAGAEPAAEVAGLADGHATQVCADAWLGFVLVDPVLVGFVWLASDATYPA